MERAGGRAAGARTLARLQRKIGEDVTAGNFYEAEQKFKAIYKRLVAAEKIDDAISQLIRGMKLFLKHNKDRCAFELGKMLLDAYKDQDTELTEEVLATLGKIFARFTAESMAADGPGASFIARAIRWSAGAPRGPTLADEAFNTREAGGAPKSLHLHAAKSFAAAEEWGSAQHHFCRASSPEEFAAFITAWAQHGVPRESGQFYARAQLLLLALANLRDASALHEAIPRSSDPLDAFCGFLIRTLERDAHPLFTELRGLYAPALAADSDFNDLLDTIEAKFFPAAVRERQQRAAGRSQAGQPQFNPNMMMNMLQGMLGGAGPAGRR